VDDNMPAGKYKANKQFVINLKTRNPYDDRYTPDAMQRSMRGRQGRKRSSSPMTTTWSRGRRFLRVGKARARVQGSRSVLLSFVTCVVRISNVGVVKYLNFLCETSVP
jgi:hypothetical protein